MVIKTIIRDATPKELADARKRQKQKTKPVESKS